MLTYAELISPSESSKADNSVKGGGGGVTLSGGGRRRGAARNVPRHAGADTASDGQTLTGGYDSEDSEQRGAPRTQRFS